MKTPEEQKISDNFKKQCVFYQILWSRYDKETGCLIQDDYLDKDYPTLKSALCAICGKPREGVLVRTTWTIIGYKKEGDKFLRCCVWNEEKKILEEI